MLKRLLSGVLAAAMVFTMLPNALFTVSAAPIDDISNVQNGDPVEIIFENLQGGQNGSLKLSKIATPTGNPNEYEITLKIEGTNVVISHGGSGKAEVVICLDLSGSMTNGGYQNGLFYWTCPITDAGHVHEYLGTRCISLTIAKWAAQKLITGLRDAGANAKVAVVTFADYATLRLPFQDVQVESEYNALISYFTNLNTASGGTAMDAGLNMSYDVLNAGDPTATKYTVVIGDGIPNSIPATTAAATHLKTLSTVYVVLFGANAQDQYDPEMIAGWATSPAHAVASEANMLGSILEGISQEIVNEVGASAVKDPLPLGVDPVLDGSGNFVYTLTGGGSVTYDGTGRIINWTPGNITQAGGSSITYKVKIDPLLVNEDGTGTNSQMIALNGDTIVTYKDPNTGEIKQARFKIPKGQGSYTTISSIGYLTNASGQYIDASGNVVAKAAAYIVSPSAGVLNPAAFNTNKWGYGTYTINAPTVLNYTATNSTASVTTSVTNRTAAAEFNYTSARTITYELNGGNLSGVTTDKVYNVKVGDTYPNPGTPTKTGYVFAGWAVSGTTTAVPNRNVAVSDTNVTYVAQWTAAGGIQYKVEHYLEQTNGSYLATPAHTDTLTGTTGAAAAFTPRTYPGYAYEDSLTTPALALRVVKADGSLVIKLYYIRANTSYKVEHYTGSTGNWTLRDTETKTGVTGNAGVYTAKSYSGYSFDDSLTVPANKTILADGTLVIKLYYKASTGTAYKVEHYIQQNDNTYSTTPYAVDSLSGTTGAAATYTAKSIPGYTFNDSLTSPVAAQRIIAADGSTVIKLYYTRATNTAYKVQHYLENGSGSYGSPILTENFSGTTGAVATFTPKTTYTGYTYKASLTTPANKEILADGSLIIKLYYEANTNTAYKVEHYTGSTGNWTLRDTENKTGTTGGTASFAAKVYAGYSYDASLTVPTDKTILADGSLVIKLYYKASTGTAYKVEHYTQNGGSWTLRDTDNLSGTTGATATFTQKTYTGYTYDSGLTVPADKTILADGSLTIKLYYKANSGVAYKVEHYLENLNGSYPAAPQDTDNLTGVTGATATFTPKTTYTGFSYQASLTSPAAAQRVIAADGSLVIRLYYTRNTDTAYKVEHYLQNSDGSTYPGTPYLTENKTGTTGAVATFAARSYDGYTYDATKTVPVDKTILANGTLVIKLYYKANTNTQYKVEHYLEQAGGGYGSADFVETKTGTTGAAATYTSRSYAGYTFNDSLTMPATGRTIAGDGSMVIKLYYTRSTGTAYKVEHYLQNGDGSYQTTPANTDNLTGTTGATATFTPKTIYTGYTYDASLTTPADKTILANGTLVIKLYYKANTNTAYKVEHYLETLTSGSYEAAPQDTDSLSGVTGATATFTPKTTYTGFSYQASLTTPANKTILANGGLVIKLFYARNTNTPYKVEHYLQIGTGAYAATPADVDNETGKTGAIATYTEKTYTGYTYQASLTVPADKTILANGSLVIKLYYASASGTAYKVEHYLENLDGSYPATPANTDNLSGVTGATATFTPKTIYTGFSYQASLTTPANKTILANGGLVIKLFYTRNSNTVYKVEHYTGSTGNWTLRDTDSKTGITGAVGTYTEKVYTGYTFDDSLTVPLNKAIAADGTLTIKLYYTPARNTPYRVEHYREQNNGSYLATPDDVDNLTGTTGTTAAFTPKTNYTGYNYSAGLTTPADKTILADGTLVIRLFYERATGTAYKVEHYLQNSDGSYPATPYLRETKSGTTGTTAVYTAQTYDGYTYNAGITTPANKTILADGSLVIRLYYEANNGTAYKVEHYREELGGGYGTAADVENRSGRTGSIATFTPKTTYAGYTYQASLTTPADKTILANGGLVIQLFYTRNTNTPYKVEHYLQSGTGAFMPSPVDTDNLTGTTGAIATYDANTYPGYEFDDTRTLPLDLAILGNGSLVVKLFYVSATNTAYKVEHYQEDLSGNYTTPYETETLYGTTGTAAAFTPKTNYTGFTYQAGLTSPAASLRVIAANGGLVIKLYYTRNSGTAYKVEHYKQNPDGSYGAPAETQNLSGVTGAQAAFAAKTYSGYTYKASATTPANKAILADGTLTIRLYYEANTDTAYKVEHYLESNTGTFGAPDYTENFSGITGDEATFAARTYAGYNYDATKTTPADKTIAGNGSLVIRLYYTRADNTAYKVEHYLLNVDGTRPVSPYKTQNLTGVTGAMATFTPETITGYTYQPGDTEPITSQRVIAADGSLVIKLFYARNTGTAYNVEHYLQNIDGTYPDTPQNTDPRTGITGAQASFNVRTYAGFTYDADATLPADKTILADGSLVIQVFYTRDTDTAYKVEHYTQNGGSWTLKDTVNHSGTTGATATFTQKTYTGYTFNGSLTQPSDLTILGDGSLTIKLYYEANTDTVYKVDYYFEDNAGVYQKNNGETVTAQGTTGALAVPEQKTFAGYTFEYSTPTNKTILADGSLVISMYYSRSDSTVYTIEHYRENPDKTTYPDTPYETEPKTGKTGVRATYAQKEYPGYTYVESLTTPSGVQLIRADGSLVIKLFYEANTNTAYKVEHYVQNVDGTYPASPTNTQNGVGITGAAITAIPNFYAGYHYVESKTVPADAADRIIEGDGSMVIKMYYDRNDNTEYTVEHYLQNGDGTWPTDAYETEDLTGITLSAAAFTAKTYEGYTYDASRTTPAAAQDRLITPDGSLVVRLYYLANTDTAYKVEHYKENLDYTYPATPNDVDEFAGTTGAQIDYQAKTYVGYTFDDSLTMPATGRVILANGSQVIKLYYILTTDTQYEVIYYTEELDHTWAEHSRTTETGRTGEVATFTAKPIEGFLYSEALTTPADKTILGDGSLVIKLYYTRNMAVYTVEHYLQNNDDTFPAVPALSEVQPEALNFSTVNAAPKTFAGYTFAPNRTMPEASLRVVQPDGSLVIKLFYTQNANTPYEVRYYLQNTDGTYPATPNETETLTGRTGAQISPNARRISGYSFKPEKTTYGDSSKLILADGSQYVNLFYDLGEATIYTIEHWKQSPDDGSVYTLHSSVQESGKTGSTATYVPIFIAGYTLDSERLPDEASLVIRADNTTVVKLYYNINAQAAVTVTGRVNYYLLNENGEKVLLDTDTFSREIWSGVNPSFTVTEAESSFQRLFNQIGRDTHYVKVNTRFPLLIKDGEVHEVVFASKVNDEGDLSVEHHYTYTYMWNGAFYANVLFDEYDVPAFKVGGVNLAELYRTLRDGTNYNIPAGGVTLYRTPKAMLVPKPTGAELEKLLSDRADQVVAVDEAKIAYDNAVAAVPEGADTDYALKVQERDEILARLPMATLDGYDVQMRDYTEKFINPIKEALEGAGGLYEQRAALEAERADSESQWGQFEIDQLAYQAWFELFQSMTPEEQEAAEQMVPPVEPTCRTVADIDVEIQELNDNHIALLEADLQKYEGLKGEVAADKEALIALHQADFTRLETLGTEISTLKGLLDTRDTAKTAYDNAQAALALIDKTINGEAMTDEVGVVGVEEQVNLNGASQYTFEDGYTYRLVVNYTYNKYEGDQGTTPPAPTPVTPTTPPGRTPYVVIDEEETPLGDLPNTSSGKSAGAVGLFSLLAGALAKLLKRDKKEDDEA